MDREHTTQRMETSIQANGMIGKDREKLNTRMEISIQDIGMVVIVINFKRHGLGIQYSADGQVLNQGKWGKVQYVDKE